MQRPETGGGVDTREKFLLTAERLFGERGINGVSLREISRAVGQRNPSALQYHFGSRDALLIGMAQACALQPGVSRSGVTITAARALGYERTEAARLVFLMSIPVIAGAGLFLLIQIGGFSGIPADMRTAFVLGTVTSAITGWFAVWFLLRLLRTTDFTPFVIYRVVLGLAVFGLLASGFR